MGNSDSIIKKQHETFEALLKSLGRSDANVIIANGKSFDIIHNGLSFFHYLVVETILYERHELQKLCDVIYKYHHKFGSCKIFAIGIW